jgi:hypothetical protein
MSKSNEVVIRIGLPLSTEVVAGLLRGIDAVWPGARVRTSTPGVDTNELLVVLPDGASSLIAPHEAVSDIDDEADPDNFDPPYFGVRPVLLTGDLFGSAGNAFTIWANCRRACEACPDLEPWQARVFRVAFVNEARTMTYPEWVDLMRTRFDWEDDFYADNPRFSAAAAERALVSA